MSPTPYTLALQALRKVCCACLVQCVCVCVFVLMRGFACSRVWHRLLFNACTLYKQYMQRRTVSAFHMMRQSTLPWTGVWALWMVAVRWLG